MAKARAKKTVEIFFGTSKLARSRPSANPDFFNGLFLPSQVGSPNSRGSINRYSGAVASALATAPEHESLLTLLLIGGTEHSQRLVVRFPALGY